MDIATIFSLLTTSLGGIGILLVVVGLIASFTRFGRRSSHARFTAAHFH